MTISLKMIYVFCSGAHIVYSDANLLTAATLNHTASLKHNFEWFDEVSTAIPALSP